MSEVLPDTSLIICTRNRPELLAAALASVLRGAQVPAEIVVIDQSDHPALTLTAQIPAGCDVRHVPSKTAGVSRARNEATRLARHSTLVFTDDDVIAPGAWFGTLVQALADAPPGTVVVGRVVPGEPETPGGFVPTLRESERPEIYRGRMDADPLVTFNMAISRHALLAVGGFDERLGPGTRYPAAEDNDLGFRLLEAGYSIAYAPPAVLHHRAWRGGLAGYARLRWGYGVGQGAFLAKHAGLRDRFILGRIVRRLVRVTLRVPRRMVRRRDLALGDVAYVAGLLAGLGSWLRRHRVRR